MKITVLQPNFFPFKSYLDVVRDVDKVIFADDSFYNKKCWVDKTIIKRNGKKFVFKIPTVSGAEVDAPLGNLVILSKNWKRNFLKMIGKEYKNSINFSKVFPVIKEVVHLPTDSVSLMSAYSVFRVSELLNCDTKFSLASIDHRELKGSFKNRIIQICKKEKSHEFHTFAMYKDTFNSHFFIRNRVDISYYACYREERYSVIDYLMNEENLF